jgi:hypothetical protein
VSHRMSQSVGLRVFLSKQEARGYHGSVFQSLLRTMIKYVKYGREKHPEVEEKAMAILRGELDAAEEGKGKKRKQKARRGSGVNFNADEISDVDEGRSLSEDRWHGGWRLTGPSLSEEDAEYFSHSAGSFHLLDGKTVTVQADAEAGIEGKRSSEAEGAIKVEWLRLW